MHRQNLEEHNNMPGPLTRVTLAECADHGQGHRATLLYMRLQPCG